MDGNRGDLRRWLSADGIELIAECYGNPEDPPIVFVHGGGQSRHSWRRGARAAAKTGLYALAIDQRGHGDSGWACDGDYSPASVASDIQILMRSLERPAILVGASRGGYATLVAAARSDPAPKALILVEIAPRIDRSGADQVRAFMRVSAQGFDSFEQASDLLAHYMKRSKSGSPERLRRSMRQDFSGRWFWRWDPKVAAGALQDWETAEIELSEAASQVRCPMLLVRGELSELVKEEHVDHLLRLAPHAKVTTIPSVGHMVSGDANDLFNSAILDFISALAEPPTNPVHEALETDRIMQHVGGPSL